ncbi:hypothetical protein [Hymenobacter ruricola]|uniref:Lipocalin-like domain-containing protein n=1 Tax=Hymenobacter ruricola TaxID=2791023 RepID=A0ABS0I7R7_9BACT|nr:hypothetical protein [Hymenobacter ruricola]MBF9223014.1 hypothetical protein [Hymenobacter ruricola]
MKRLFPALLLLLGALSASRADNPPTLVPGTYGVHATGPATALPTLTLRPDFTFRYANPSGAARPQELAGTWALAGDQLVLTSPNAAKPMKWRLDPSGPCLTTRQGLCFTRLCQLSQ